MKTKIYLKTKNVKSNKKVEKENLFKSEISHKNKNLINWKNNKSLKIFCFTWNMGGTVN